MSSRLFLLVFSPLLLCGCAPDRWSRPDLTHDVFARDDASCMATATGGPQPATVQGGAGAGVTNMGNAISNASAEQDAYRFCMVGRGYARVQN